MEYSTFTVMSRCLYIYLATSCATISNLVINNRITQTVGGQFRFVKVDAGGSKL